MGLTKLIIALIVLICIGVLGHEAWKRRSKEKMVSGLTDELDTINDSFVKTDLEIDVVDLKTELKAKRATLAEKTVDLNTTAPTPPPGRTIKEGEQPPKPAKKKAAPKKKVAKKKAVKKKAAPKTGKK